MTFRQIGERIRIESGPAMRVAVASPELLDDAVTAAHYQMPRPASADEIADPAILTPDGTRVFLDALGVPIEEGRKITYLDWKAASDGIEGATVFYVYAHEPMTEAEVDERGLTLRADWSDLSDDDRLALAMIWHQIDCCATEDEAIASGTAYLIANP